MAPQKKNKLKGLPASRVAKAGKEMLIEGAASMSGKKVKDIAQSMVSGALMSETAATNKIRRKAQRKQFIKSLQKTKKPSVTVDPKEIKTKILKDKPGQYYTPGTIKGEFLQNNKKSTNKMKKESAFKMKGFSGFKNESPTKQKGKANATKETTYKNPKMKQDNYASRSDTVLASAKNYPGYYSLNKENKAKVQGAIDRLDGYVPSNKEAYRQFKGR